MSLSITQEPWARYLHNIHVHKHLHTVLYTFTENRKVHIIRWSQLQNQYTVDNRYLISLHSFRTYFSVLSQSRSHSNELLSRLNLSSKVWVWVGALACWHALCLPPDRTLSTRLNYPLHDDSMQQSKKWRSPDSCVFRFFQMDSSGPPHAADQGGSRNIARYGSRLFDIQLIRKYQLWLDSLFIDLCVRQNVCVCVCIYAQVWKTLTEFDSKPPLKRLRGNRLHAQN